MTAQYESIDVSGPEGSFSAYLALPSAGNGVAVVLLQEIFGVNANMRAIAGEFARAGYAVIAPDLFWRQARGVELDPSSEQGRERAMDLMKGLDRNQSVADGSAALAALRERVPDLARSAAVGYCYGGGVAYLMATSGAVNAAVSYYGTGLQSMLGELKNNDRRLLLHIASEDHLCQPEARDAISAAASKAGSQVDVVVHEGVGHAFARVGGSAYNKPAADKANEMTMELLGSIIRSS